MHILITGVNGFIGSNVLKHMNECGQYNIIGTDIGEKYIGEDDITYIQANFAEDNFVEHMVDAITRCDVIIHVGAYINYDLFSKDVTMANCYGVQQIIKLAKVLDCKKIIFISSLPVVGKPQIIPVTEEHPVNPQTAYHASKVFAEHLLLMKHDFDLTATIFRITSPIGIGMPLNRMLSTFINNCKEDREMIIYGKGKRKQNYIDVRDIAMAIELACKKNVNGILNIAGDRSYTSLELAEACNEVLNKQVPIKYKDVELEDEDYDWEISIDKAHVELGYIPRYTLEQSIIDISNY